MVLSNQLKKGEGCSKRDVYLGIFYKILNIKNEISINNAFLYTPQIYGTEDGIYIMDVTSSWFLTILPFAKKQTLVILALR